MDNQSNSISQSISDSLSKASNSTIERMPSSSLNTSSSFFGWFSSISWSIWLILILLLAFLGFNIFTYLGKGVEKTGGLLNTIIEKIKSNNTISNTFKQLINTSASGTKSVLNTSNDVANNTLNKIQNATEVNEIKGSQVNQNQVKGVSVETNINTSPVNNLQANTLNNALNNSSPETQNHPDYEADDSYSSIQTNKNKAGWCFIGEDRGFRTCAQVGVNDTCMSGEIFPSNDICINPSLRS